MVWPSTFSIHNMLFLSEPRTIFVVFDDAIHVVPCQASMFSSLNLITLVVNVVAFKLLSLSLRDSNIKDVVLLTDNRFECP